jgi:hypothetical protein
MLWASRQPITGLPLRQSTSVMSTIWLCLCHNNVEWNDFQQWESFPPMKGARMGMCDSFIPPIIYDIRCKVSNFFEKTLNWNLRGNYTIVFWRYNLTMQQNSFRITNKILLTIPKRSSISCKLISLSNCIKDIATLYFIKIESFIFVWCFLK